MERAGGSVQAEGGGRISRRKRTVRTGGCGIWITTVETTGAQNRACGSGHEFVPQLPRKLLDPPEPVLQILCQQSLGCLLGVRMHRLGKR